MGCQDLLPVKPDSQLFAGCNRLINPGFYGVSKWRACRLLREERWCGELIRMRSSPLRNEGAAFAVDSHVQFSAKSGRYRLARPSLNSTTKAATNSLIRSVGNRTTEGVSIAGGGADVAVRSFWA